MCVYNVLYFLLEMFQTVLITMLLDVSLNVEIYSMNTNMTGLRWFSQITASLCFGQM